MIRHVFLDMDETLLDFGAQEETALRHSFQALGIDMDAPMLARYRQINLEQWRLHDLGLLTRDQVLYGRFELLFSELALDASARQMEDTYRHRLSLEAIPIPGALAALDYLSGKYSLYIATNGLAQTQYDRLELAGMRHYFRDIFISDELGIHKPEREFFLRAFARIPGLVPAQTIIIGDHLRCDIRGGQNAGIHTCWFNFRHNPPKPDVVPEYTITDWSEISTIL